jgi:ATP synthase in type III secretion protein N
MIARSSGRVVATFAHTVEASIPAVRVGDAVRIRARTSDLCAHVDSVRDGRVHLTPHGDVRGVAVGDRVEVDPALDALPLGMQLLGCAIDPSGRPIDERAPRSRRSSGRHAALAPLERRELNEPMWCGVRTIDGLLTFAQGARVGIFGPPGAGKSTLLETIARGTTADAVVVGLIGERGREAERWIRICDQRTSIVCATGDRAAAERMRAAETAVAQAEALRDRGLSVLLILDSLARAAAAAREIAVASGEAPGRGGYPPRVLSGLAGLLERAGRARSGSITLVATVLTEGPNELDPLGETIRSLVDGHVVLDGGLARAGRFPAIDVLCSASRTMQDVISPEHAAAAGRVRASLARLAESADLRAAGLEAPGRDPVLDRAVAALGALERFLYGDGPTAPRQTLDELLALADIV